jgi:biofilm protein TabA
MVFDSLKNAESYYGLGKGIEKALKYFECYDSSQHDNSVVELDGKNVYVVRNTYTTAPSENPLFEAHREYIDVMYVAEGEEAFYYKPLEEVINITREYDSSIEACLGKIDEDACVVRFPAGFIAIFMPQDAHCAGQLWNESSNVKKLIAKVRVETNK